MGESLERRAVPDRRVGADRRAGDPMVTSNFFERRWRPERRLPKLAERTIADSEWESYFAAIERRAREDGG